MWLEVINAWFLGVTSWFTGNVDSFSDRLPLILNIMASGTKTSLSGVMALFYHIIPAFFTFFGMFRQYGIVLRIIAIALFSGVLA